MRERGKATTYLSEEQCSDHEAGRGERGRDCARKEVGICHPERVAEDTWPSIVWFR